VRLKIKCGTAVNIDRDLDQPILLNQRITTPAGVHTGRLFTPGTQTDAKRATVEPEATFAIAEGLARDHLTDAQISAILGENWLRVAEQVWR
jgi:hypothetical protein